MFSRKTGYFRPVNDRGGDVEVGPARYLREGRAVFRDLCCGDRRADVGP
jgi:hypothetical protein